MRPSHLLREMNQHQCSLFRRHFVLLCRKTIENLFRHRLEDRLQQRAAKYLRDVIARQTVAVSRHVTVAEPPARQKRGRSHKSVWDVD